jgi:hypothetical protein
MLNKTGAPAGLDNGTLTLPTNYLPMHAGTQRPGAQLQFQAPSAGTYSVKLNVMGLNTKGEHGEGPQYLIVYENGNAVYTLDFGGSGHGKYKNNFTLAAGDTLSFVAGNAPKDKPDYIGVAIKIIRP